ncbi:hypothetical protein KU6B_26340 [Mameliella alba]|uniref:hybrid sensor histidine kinase/response regulator n=1 Tax=Mameliella alba TaxID=561184 RepID=UPI0013E52202|nr:ATP-binding protein [Mameliella alba]BBU56369.1 hypothetical protein KU6B_26340 [Mameliella alba]
MPATDSDTEKDARIWSDVIHLMPAWTWQADADFRLRYVNIRHSGLRMTADELIGLRILSPEGQGQDQAGIDRLMQVMRAGQEIRSLSYERVLVNGSRAVLMDSAVPLHDADGRFAGYHGITLNISDVLRKAEVADSLIAGLNRRTAALEQSLVAKAAELTETNRLLTEIVEGMGEGLLVTSGTRIDDPENRILRVNAAYLRLHGLGNGDVPVGMRFRDHIDQLIGWNKATGDEQFHVEVQEMLSAGEKVMLRIPDSGRSFYLQATPRPSGGHVLVHTDITDLRNQNAALRAARDAADVANKAKSSFLANMSHEIRTPMNGIVGMADLLTETDLSAEQADYVATIRSAALALTSLISDILDFSKVEAGRLEIEQAPFAPASLVEEVRHLLVPLAGQKGLGLRCTVDADVPGVVAGDALRIRQVLMNLMGNAIKFTVAGEVSLHLSRAAPTGGNLRFAVADTGIGIPADRLSAIFDPFEQVHQGRDRAFEGTGLGLTISKRLIDAMGGEISARSDLGVGSVFAVDLPLPAVASGKPLSEPLALAQMRLDGIRVLVAEDNRTNQAVAQKLLERRGAAVTLVDDGRAAVELFHPDRFDLVLMDLSMPVMNGLDATRMIRETARLRGWPHRPIIALTGNAFEKDREEARAVGMDGFLSKPVRSSTLMQAIATQLEGGDGTRVAG